MNDQPPPAAASASGQHLPILDVWRGTAISLLLIGHFSPVPKINCGRLGVEFFFVLSGFLMAKLLFLKQTPLGRFYRRRISRIFPTAYAFLATMLILGLVLPMAWKPAAPGVASCFLFYMNYYVALGPPFVNIGLPADHFWSLCVEEHTYIYLSILAIFHRKTGGSAMMMLVASLAACFAASVIVGKLEGWNYYRVYWRSDCRAGSILCGAIVALLDARGVGRLIRHGRVLAILFVLAGIVLNFNRVPDLVKYTVGTASLAAGLLLVSRHFRGDHPALRPLAWLGTVSYSVYLWQQPLSQAVDIGTQGRIPGIGLGVLAVVAGLASYTWIERPARDRLNAAWAG